MRAVSYAGSTALVTGASSGIGAAFARELAVRGANLALAALPAEQERLDDLAAELARRHGIRAAGIGVDLAAPDGPHRLQQAADALDLSADVLVNSAGIGGAGPFAHAPLERELAMINLNVVGLVALTRLYLPRMVARRRGVIVNVGSTAGLQPMPYFAVYAAGKAFVHSFGQALWAEARRAGVRTVTLCTGPVDTEFHRRSGDAGREQGLKRRLKQRRLTAEQVVDAALRAVDRDRPVVVMRIPGARPLYGAAALAAGLAGRRLRLRALERANRWLFGVR